MIGESWQARTAAALVIGAVGEGLAVLLSQTVGGAFVLATFAVAFGLGFAYGPWMGGVGAGLPPIGVAFAGSDDAFSQRALAALAVVLLLGGSAWMTGRVRERYGHPPWGHSSEASE